MLVDAIGIRELPRERDGKAKYELAPGSPVLAACRSQAYGCHRQPVGGLEIPRHEVDSRLPSWLSRHFQLDSPLSRPTRLLGTIFNFEPHVQ